MTPTLSGLAFGSQASVGGTTTSLTLEPTFNPDVSTYSVTLPYGSEAVVATPTPTAGTVSFKADNGTVYEKVADSQVDENTLTFLNNDAYDPTPFTGGVCGISPPYTLTFQPVNDGVNGALFKVRVLPAPTPTPISN